MVSPAAAVPAPRVTPQGRASKLAALVQRIKLDVEFSKLLQVAVVTGDDALACFQTRVSRRQPSTHHLNDRVRAADLEVLLAAARRARCSHFVINKQSAPDDGRVADPTGYLKRQSAGSSCTGDVSAVVNSEA